MFICRSASYFLLALYIFHLHVFIFDGGFVSEVPTHPFMTKKAVVGHVKASQVRVFAASRNSTENNICLVSLMKIF
jgi:hypothetical protein